ncbi:MAG: HEAT repeat domain-containing protein, partial [Myxococcales bacterium]|nr:HEAT repeat domain-containing protein [Myxococcales bacterium]
EFGDHGGRYHGTTVYEEQVRVPLVVVGPGVRHGARVEAVVQTIDLLPTVLSAVGIPRPARVRGRDLGGLLSAPPPPAGDPGFAFSEAEDYALVASGRDRLICERRAAACALYRPNGDPLERRDLHADDPARFETLRAMLRTLELDHGRFEAAAGPTWPEALRRGMQGETEAAPDVAPLLDDADVAVRRKAAEVLWGLRAPVALPALRRAFARDEDEEVRRWCGLALARLEPPPAAAVLALLRDGDRAWRRRAALVLAERGDTRACDEVAAWWAEIAPPPGKESADGEPPRLGLDLPQAEELLSATGKARCRGAVSALLRALADVRARPYVADTLGLIGDERAGPALVSALATEPYVTARGHEARALLALGARDWQAPTPSARVDATLRAPAHTRAAELLVLLSDAGASLEARAAGAELPPAAPGSEVRALELARVSGPSVHVELRVSSGGVLAAWLVPRGRLD